MRASIQALQKDLSDLEHFSRFLEAGAALRAAAVDDKTGVDGTLVVDFQTDTAELSSAAFGRLAYNTMIISLYGALERFLEDLIQDYVQFLNAVIPEFEKLPVPLRDKHRALTVDVLKNLDQPRFITGNGKVHGGNTMVTCGVFTGGTVVV